MAQVIYARRALAELERVAEFLSGIELGPAVISAAIDAIAEAVELLERHPHLGRPCEHGLSELVISRGKTGYIALYDFLETEDVVLVLALRHQRELSGADR